MKEAMALMNCPKVSTAARCPPPITQVTRGLSEVCMRALPMPSNEKAQSITAKLSPQSGRSSDRAVMPNESNTVFFLPILFNTPVGTLKMRNQKNTSEGKMLATESLRWRSALT